MSSVKVIENSPTHCSLTPHTHTHTIYNVTYAPIFIKRISKKVQCLLRRALYGASRHARVEGRDATLFRVH